MACNKNESISANESKSNEFSRRFSQAFSSVDEKLIISTITYMDILIKQEGNKNIASIYLNKAQLLYKLKRYDEALEVLYQANDNYYDVYKASLLIKLGRVGEAEVLLQNAIDENKKILNNELVSKEQKEAIIQGTIALYILSDKSVEPLFNELVTDKVITQQEASAILAKTVLSKKMILDSIWIN
jgi:tetratricopeptide (TPR) repeat protein